MSANLTREQFAIMREMDNYRGFFGPRPDHQGEFVRFKAQDVAELLAEGMIQVNKVAVTAPETDGDAPYLIADHWWQLSPAGRQALASQPADQTRQGEP